MISNPIRPARNRRRNTRAVVVLGAVALCVAPVVALAPGASAAPAGSAGPATAFQASSQVRTGAAPGTAVRAEALTGVSTAKAAPDAYVAVVRSGTRRHLQVVSRSSGKVLRTVATIRGVKSTDIEPITDADLAPDGSVWAVQADRRLPAGYQSSLVRYVGTKVTMKVPYVTSVRLSPDSTRLAVSVFSPDGDRDGYGLEAVRLLRTNGKAVSTLASYKFPVDRTNGYPMVGGSGWAVRGWFGSTDLIVTAGCCDSGSVSIVPTAKAVPPQKWPTFAGNGDTTALGTKGANILVARSRWVGAGTEADPLNRVGMDVYWMSKSKPKGTFYAFYKGDSIGVDDFVEPLLKKTKAAPVWVSTTHFPYKGAGTILAAYQ